MVSQMLAESRLAYKPLTKAELGQILIDFSTVKEAENPLAEPRFIKRSEFFENFRKVTKLKKLI